MRRDGSDETVRQFQARNFWLFFNKVRWVHKMHDFIRPLFIFFYWTCTDSNETICIAEKNVSPFNFIKFEKILRNTLGNYKMKLAETEIIL